MICHYTYQFRLKMIDFFGHSPCCEQGMTKTITLSLALVIIAGSFLFLRRATSRASVNPFPDAQTCGDQYNALVIKAKQSLAHNDRVSAINSLLQARSQLAHCEELQEHDANAPHAVALNTIGNSQQSSCAAASVAN
jgi:hypothetical protein